MTNGIIECKLTFLADSIFQSSELNQQRVSMLKKRQNLSRKQHQLLNHAEKPYTLENPDLYWRLFYDKKYENCNNLGLYIKVLLTFHLYQKYSNDCLISC